MSHLLIARPPRRSPPPVPSGEVVLAPPPPRPQAHTGAASWMAYLLPMLGGGGSILFIFINMGSNPSAASRNLYIASGALFAVASLGGGLGMFFHMKSSVRRKARTDRERYFEYLARTRRTALQTASRQRAASAWLHPGADQLSRLVSSRARVWERRATDPDFLTVRFGLGSGPLATPLRLTLDTNPSVEYDSVSATEASRLALEHNRVPGLPLVISLTNTPALSLVGDQAARTSLARAVVCQLASFHSPDDLRLALCFGRNRASEWDWVKWLPHTLDPQADDGAESARLISDSPEILADRLSTDIAARRLARSEHSSHLKAAAPKRPHLVVVVDHAESIKTLAHLLRSPGQIGVSVLHLPLDQADSMADSICLRVLSDGVLSVENMTQPGETGTVHADGTGPNRCRALARMLMPLRLSRPSSSRPLTEDLTLPDLLGIPDVRAIDLKQTWARAERQLLSVPIGVDPQGEPVVLDLKEAALGGMGPHGVIVGATGSGKSELLRTLVTGLVVTHPPDQLSLVLIDFKGGATFAGMSDLPHVAGVITNLQNDLALIDRVHAALSGEMSRRQEVLRQAGNLDSVQTYQRQRARRSRLDPLPHLLIVVDEFSELLSARPDFSELFVAIGRLGRSLGIHLLLASQRLDEGRLRGLESHLSYRIALRTFTAMESRSVIDVPDAYHLPAAPGSGYLKVDVRVFQRFKAAMVSAPLRKVSKPIGEVIRVEAFTALADPVSPQPLASAQPSVRAGRLDLEGPSLGQVMVEGLRGAARPVHQIWLPPLERALTLDMLVGQLQVLPERGLVAAQWPGVGRLAVPIGIVDRPAEQTKAILDLDLSGPGGHLAVVGAPQSGKSTLLRTLITSCALTHSPTELQLYCIDLGGGGLASLSGLPHVGTAVGRNDPERVERTVAQLLEFLNEREKLFRSSGIDSIQSLRDLRAAGRLPHEPHGDVFLVIDNWGALRLDFPDLEAAVVEIASRGLGYGLHVVITANRWMEIRANLLDNIGTRLELRLNDPSDSQIDRRMAAHLPADIPGRGLIPERLQFQVALPRVDGRLEIHTLQSALDHLVQNVAEAWTGPSAPPVRVLPTQVLFTELPHPSGDRWKVPIGISGTDFGPVNLNLGPRGDAHLLVFGDRESGKTNFLSAFLLGLTARSDPSQVSVLLVDQRRTLLEAIPDPYLLGYSSNATATTLAVTRLRETLTARLPGPDLTARQLRKRDWWAGPEIYVVVDDYDLIANGHPLAPLVEFLPQSADVGFHMILARQVAGTARASYEPLLAALKEQGNPGLILSGDPHEGPLLGTVRAQPGPPGRGLLIRRRHRPLLVQTALVPPVP